MMRCSWLDLQALKKSSKILNVNPYEQVRKKIKNIYQRWYIFGPKREKEKREKLVFLQLTCVVDRSQRCQNHLSLIDIELELEDGDDFGDGNNCSWCFFGRERESREMEGERMRGLCVVCSQYVEDIIQVVISLI